MCEVTVPNVDCTNVTRHVCFDNAVRTMRGRRKKRGVNDSGATLPEINDSYKSTKSSR